MKVGDIVRIVNRVGGHEFEIGSIAKITDKLEESYTVTDISGDYWYMGRNELEVIECKNLLR